MSSQQELSSPLIGTELHEVKREDRAADDCYDTAIAITTDEEDTVFFDSVVTLLLTFLLLVQFNIAFYLKNSSVDDLSFPLVGLSIALFAFTSLLYRRSLAERAPAESHSCAVYLVPEITALIVVFLIYFQYMAAGFLVMTIGTSLMALMVAVNSALALHEATTIDNKVEDEKPCEVKILVV